MCGNATEQDQCNTCKVFPEGGCCPEGNTVVAKKVCKCVCNRDAYMCLRSTNMRWDDGECVSRVFCVQGYWEEDDEEKCKTTAYWQGGRCILFHSTNAVYLFCVCELLLVVQNVLATTG